MNTLSIEKSFCTTREAATLLGVSVGTVQLWVESGLLDAWKTAGGHRRVMRESVDRLLHKVPAFSHNKEPIAAPLTTERRLNVLVVEDDVHLLRLYQAKLSAWAMAPQVVTMDNAFAALLTMGRSAPDLLIADLHMPGMDGFEMLRVLSNAPEMAQTTIVVVTGLDASAVTARGGIPKDIEVLAKPIPFDQLQAIAVAIATKKHLYQAQGKD
jgi:excisionase family DNA binding protein